MRTLLFTTIFLISIRCFAPPFEEKEDIKKLTQIKSFDTKEFTRENFIAYVKLYDPEHADIIIKQAILETGWFKSGSFKKHNNLFGMRVAKSRPNKITGQGYGHASFAHWTDSVEDYFLWRSYMLRKKNLHMNDYYTFLEQVGYATAHNYTSTLKKIKIYV